MKRIRYNRGSIESTIAAARRVVAGSEQVRFVQATHGGFTITTVAPPFNGRGYRVSATGVERCGRWQ